ncbi:hypothetical protein [Comamonas sp.]
MPASTTTGWRSSAQTQAAQEPLR